jgi:Pentapeptide repeats (8 copies)
MQKRAAGAATLAQCDLRQANLTDANLAGLDLTTTASLAGANLSGTQLPGTKLPGVDLTGVILVGADLTKAVITKDRGMINEQHYDDQGKLIQPFPMRYPASAFPALDGSTICPNGHTHADNQENGPTIDQEKPPTQLPSAAGDPEGR